MNPLDTPHHMKIDDVRPFREGVVLDKKTKTGAGSWVDVGCRKLVRIDRKLTPGVRVTVQMPSADDFAKGKGIGKVVAPSTPRTTSGTYWGYQVRVANSISDVWTGCPYDGGYDFSLGTSERGEDVDGGNFSIPDFKHLLIVFGGVEGLESAVEADPDLDVETVEDLFDRYVNTCPGQGSGTIRTEEAILISMAAFRPHIRRAVANSCDIAALQMGK